MSRADELLNKVQGAVGDKPFVLIAGAGDLINQKLRELPDAVAAWQAENKDFPLKAAGALVGSAFRANLKVGELYDELTRRGEDRMARMRGDEIYAEEDEPFIREPFKPEPVRPQAKPPKASAKKAPATKVSAKKAPATKVSAKKVSAKKASAAKKSGTVKKSTVAKKVARTSPAKKSGAAKSAAAKSAAATKKTAAVAPVAD